MMEDTPANYNMENQRFHDDDYEHDVIPEEDDMLPKTKKVKRRKKKKKVKPPSFLAPTIPEINMASAYGGVPKG